MKGCGDEIDEGMRGDEIDAVPGPGLWLSSFINSRKSINDHHRSTMNESIVVISISIIYFTVRMSWARPVGGEIS